MRRITFWLLTLLMLPVLAACTRMADETTVRDIVQSRLDAVFNEPVLKITNLRRLGSGSLGSENGVARGIVYYNAQLEFVRDYALSDWENLNAASLATLLGASERGITGIDSDGNQVGDVLNVRGSVTFEDKNGWQAANFVAPASSYDELANGGANNARQLIEQIQGILRRPDVAEPVAKQIITEELNDAHRAIVRRLDRLQRAFIIAGGPALGEYQVVAQALADQIAADGVRAAAIETHGSVENLQLLARGEADVALVQSDIALMAYNGSGLFAAEPANNELRAIASLFPEPVHIVVRADSPIASVEDLAGKRVDLGLPNSGTRGSALAVLGAYGIGETDIQAQPGRNIGDAARALINDEIDAFVAVISAPARQLQQLAASGKIRFLALSPVAIEKLGGAQSAFVPLTLAAGSYPGQTLPIATVAVTALLAARADTPEADVKTALTALFDKTDFIAAGSAAGALIAPGNAAIGLTLPPHPSAQPYLFKNRGQFTLPGTPSTPAAVVPDSSSSSKQ